MNNYCVVHDSPEGGASYPCAIQFLPAKYGILINTLLMGCLTIAHDPSWGNTLRSSPLRRRISMKDNNTHVDNTHVSNEQLISPTIKKISVLKLSPFGQARLTAFPDEAISYAVSEYKRQATDKLHHPYAYFYSLCKKYCDQHKINPHWWFVHQVCSRLNIKASEPLLPKPNVAVRRRQGIIKQNSYATYLERLRRVQEEEGSGKLDHTINSCMAIIKQL
jgi:hypothetical protein